MHTNKVYSYIILLAVSVTLFTNFGFNNTLHYFLFINEAGSSYTSALESTYLAHHQWWRLLSPTFLHFSLTHLIFNCLWIYILGSRIEIIDGKNIFLLVFLLTSLAGNLGEFLFTGNYFFGGLSGAVYGLIGYCFIIELDNRFRKYDLTESIYIFMFLWLLLGFTGLLSVFGFGNVANTAHLVGMISGFILGLIIKSTTKI